MGKSTHRRLPGTDQAAHYRAAARNDHRDIDRLVDRRQNRPLVASAVTPRAALTFAVSLEVLAFVELWALVNLLSAVLADPGVVIRVDIEGPQAERDRPRPRSPHAPDARGRHRPPAPPQSEDGCPGVS